MNSFFIKNSQTIYEVIRIPLNELRPLNFIDNNKKTPKLIEGFFSSIFYFKVLTYLLPRYLPGSKTPTLKYSGSKEVRWGFGLPIKARLVRSDNQWG